MSRQLMFSAMLSIAMMATFVLGSQAYAGDDAAQDFAECTLEELEQSPAAIDYSVPSQAGARLALSAGSRRIAPSIAKIARGSVSRVLS